MFVMYKVSIYLMCRTKKDKRNYSIFEFNRFKLNQFNYYAVFDYKFHMNHKWKEEKLSDLFFVFTKTGQHIKRK